MPQIYHIRDMADVEVGISDIELRMFTGDRIRIHSHVLADIIRKLTENQETQNRRLAMGLSEPKQDKLWPEGLREIPVWHASGGRELPVTEMDTSHIINTIEWIKRRRYILGQEVEPTHRRLKYYHMWLGIFAQELKRRNA